MKKFRVLQVNKYYPPVIGGVEKVVQNLSEGLAKRTDVRALVCNQKGGYQKDDVNGVEVVRTASPGKLFSMPISLSFFRHFKRLSKKADIIQFHMPFPLGDLGLLLPGYRGKIAVYWHSDIVRQKRLLKLYQPILRAFLRRADVIMVATKWHIESSLHLMPYREKCVVIPYGIDAESYVKDADPNRILIKCKQDMADVLFVGRLVYYKGVDVLLKAIALVPDAQLTIAGEGPLKEDLMALADDLDIAHRVRFVGQCSDAMIKACLRDCDMMVLPSVQNSEAFGLVQLQAMCFAKPVINTNLPTGVPSVCVHEQQGLTVPPGDAMAMADAIRRLVKDPDYAKKLGESGYRHVREDFSMERMIDGVFVQYKKLLDISEDEIAK